MLWVSKNDPSTFNFMPVTLNSQLKTTAAKKKKVLGRKYILWDKKDVSSESERVSFGKRFDPQLWEKNTSWSPVSWTLLTIVSLS